VDNHYRDEQRHNAAIGLVSIGVLGAAGVMYSFSHMEAGTQAAKNLFMLAGCVGVLASVGKAAKDTIMHFRTLRQVERNRFDTN
jgi:hypothetical protein